MWFGKYWKADICGLIILLFVGFFIWLGNKNINDNDIKPREEYFVTEQNRVLSVLENDIEHITRIICAESDHLSLLTSANNIIDYKYEYEAIWYNGIPLIKGVKSFHFEYRDTYGNLLTHLNHNYNLIESIGCFVRKDNGKREIIYKKKIDMPDQMLCYLNY